MRSAGNTQQEKTILLLLAVMLGSLELFIPRVPLFPWLKPGLAHSVTIIWIIRYGTADALLSALLRIWCVGFYFGFPFFGLALGLSGTVVATFIMGAAWHIGGKRRLIGSIGIGICGAVAHNAGQLVMVYVLLARNRLVFYQAPAMLLAAIVAGSLTGTLAWWFQAHAIPFVPSGRQHDTMASSPRLTRPPLHSLLFSLVLLGFCIVIALVPHVKALGILTLLCTLGVQLLRGPNLSLLGTPLRRFWLLFVSVALLPLFSSYGTRISFLPWITREGLEASLRQVLRLWIWLQAVALFSLAGFSDVVLWLLSLVFRSPASRQTLAAGLTTLIRFPDAIERGRALQWARALRHPRTRLPKIGITLLREAALLAAGPGSSHTQTASHQERG